MCKVFNEDQELPFDRAFKELYKNNPDIDLILELIELIPNDQINEKITRGTYY